MKKLLFVSLLLIIFLGCDFITLPPNVVNSYLKDLSFIPAPSRGNEPLILIDHHEYTGTIAWIQEDDYALLGAFKEGEKYTAKVLLTPKKDYTFEGFEETFIHRGAAQITQIVADKYASVNIEFARLPWPNTVHKYLNDLSFIPAPSNGAEPLWYFEAREYNGAVSWTNSNGAYIIDNFKEGTAYTAEVYLTAKSEFTFAGFEETFIHKDAVNISQVVTPGFVTVTINFAKLPFTDADFISLKGERLKTFNMIPDSSQLDLLHIFDFTGTVSFISYGSSNVTAYSTNSITTTLPLKAFFAPENYTAIFSGFIASNNAAGNPLREFSNRSFPSSQFINKLNQNYFYYESSESEQFNSNSYVLPGKGYDVDRNYIEFKNVTYPSLSLSSSQCQTISNLTAGAYSYHHTTLSTEPFYHLHAFRQVSRDFYLYRSVSITFDPAIELLGWQGSAIIDRFTMDTKTNTLTAVFKAYTSSTLGEAFSFYIVAENGAVIRKAVSIRN